MKKILVIDDDMEIRQGLRQAFERAGFEVIEAPDGMEGMKLYRQAPTDLVLTDIVMPKKDGIELIIELKRDFPDAKIIAASSGSRGIGTHDSLDAAKHLGANCTFSKPIDEKELLETVQGILVSSSSQE